MIVSTNADRLLQLIFNLKSHSLLHPKKIENMMSYYFLVSLSSRSIFFVSTFVKGRTPRFNFVEVTGFKLSNVSNKTYQFWHLFACGQWESSFLTLKHAWHVSSGHWNQLIHPRIRNLLENWRIRSSSCSPSHDDSWALCQHPFFVLRKCLLKGILWCIFRGPVRVR